MAHRLLRVNILAPITDRMAIERRLEVVQELVNDEEIIGYSAPPIRIRSADLLLLYQSQGLNDDALSAGGGGSFGASFGAITKKVYAVRANYNRLLDVARETYRENVTDIIDLQGELSKEHDLPISMQWQDNGFVFVLKKGDVPQGTKSLPRPFINASMKKNGRWLFSHLELKKRNTRLKDSLDEALLLSDQIVKALVERILEDIGVLYKASEAIGLLDMLWSFAHTSILHNYTRPEFTGTLAIKAGRHPVLEKVQVAGNFVPNDTYACDGSSFQIIEGPNMSGKSTYLRQIGTLAVMAMCGCFVPAEYASFRIHDALLTRLSNDDDPERSLSTFAKEMTTSKQHTYRPIDVSTKIPTLSALAGNAIGLELARLADLPPDVLTEARKVSTKLKAQDDRVSRRSLSLR
ncbi:unnamed protein product [Rhizoctonia solani]|uniref:DNA mismatch repair proteins mutS family domain-containing protein n=1 Tax=Rhizoctonia solani TaxID=456999 RepID=A0A8H2XE21_9AGAM|nr:unnamed protein product [Rhizoctonia solani]